jgi:hypothetical protein
MFWHNGGNVVRLKLVRPARADLGGSVESGR